MDINDDWVWIDGCFDFTHHGHAGAILQARQTVNTTTAKLFCGVHNDAEICHNKGVTPVMTEEERYAHTRSNRWCDEVVTGAPYTTEKDWMDRYRCQYVVHGDDITLTADGEDCYGKMKALNRFKEVKRTPSVSTTDIIQRMLWDNYRTTIDKTELPTETEFAAYCKGSNGLDPYCYVFDTTYDDILIEGGYKLNDTKLILVSGDFDLFHVGHIERLCKIKESNGGTNCKVVIHVTVTPDKDIMTLKERLLSALSCRYVDGAILNPCEQLQKTQINLYDEQFVDNTSKFSQLTKDTIIDRIQNKKTEYVERNRQKGMSITS